MVLQVQAPNAATPLTERAVQRLRFLVQGDVVLPGEGDYDQARLVYNRLINRHPAALVRPRDAEDIVTTVRIARDYELPLAVRSGGHGFPGFGTVDGGIVLDLAGAKGFGIDPDRRVAWAEPGLTWGEYGLQAAKFGLATPAGDTGSVGVGGLTLGGGIGWLARKHGLTIDSLISAEVVTADGRQVTASEDAHPDLFWALRGGGGNFGIVTSFQFRLHEVSMVLGGAIAYPATAEVLRAYVDQAAAAPDELTTITFVMQAPPLPVIPADKHGSIAVIIMPVYAGDLEEGQKAFAPFRSLAGVAPIADMVGPMPYTAMYQLTEDATRPSAHCARSGYLRAIDDATIEAILDYTKNPTSPMSFAQIRVLGGAMARVPADATAFAHRDKPYMVSVINVWDGAAEQRPERHVAWTEAFWRMVEPKSDGVYANFLEAEGESRIRAAYPGDTYTRLAAIKRAYDPDNVFRLNQNIKPAL